MDLELSGRHVLITGASKGIGYACAATFVREGAHVSLVARDEAALRAAADRLRAIAATATIDSRIHFYAADLKDAEAARGMVEQVETSQGEVDILVNSAGAARRELPGEIESSAWLSAIEAKYLTYMNVTLPVVDAMAARGGGAVVSVVGSGGKFPIPTHLPGGAANAALMLANVGLAGVHAKNGVRINVVNPGTTLTDRQHEGMAVAARHQGVTPDEAMRLARDKVPLGRLAEPEDIATVVAFLASARASYVTGVVMTMDGALNLAI